MHVVIPHKFTKDAAIARVKSSLVEAAPKIAENAKDFETHWEGDTLHFAGTVQGSHIEGTLQVLEHEFELNAKLPLLWRMFEGQIESAIKKQVAALA